MPQVSRAMTSRYFKDLDEYAECDVIIAGAGSAGLSCAYELSKHPDVKVSCPQLGIFNLTLHTHMCCLLLRQACYLLLSSILACINMPVKQFWRKECGAGQIKPKSREGFSMSLMCCGTGAGKLQQATQEP